MECDPDCEDETLFPHNFPDCGNKTFKYVFENKRYQEWVEFTMKEMENATGFFKIWQAYCLRKSK